MGSGLGLQLLSSVTLKVLKPKETRYIDGETSRNSNLAATQTFNRALFVYPVLSLLMLANGRESRLIRLSLGVIPMFVIAA